MSLIDMKLRHGRTWDEARSAMEQAVQELQDRFGPLIRRAVWDTHRNQVRVEGLGFWVEMKVDAQEVHVSADLPVLGGLLGSPLGTGIKQIVRKSFEQAVP